MTNRLANLNERISEAISHYWLTWLGYMFLLEDCPSSQTPVKVKEPHFKVFPEFVNASYAKRYELFSKTG